METAIKSLISRVNSTLSHFELNYTSAIRTPISTVDKRERCTSFEQYIEIRFNFEASRVPELETAIIKTEGHLFKCVLLDNIDLPKRRFSTAYVELVDIAELPLGTDESLKDELTKVVEYLGGTKIEFNNVCKKIKYKIL